MATTTENLTARIQIDVGDSTKNVKDLEKELKGLQVTINKSSNAVAPFSANMLKLGAGIIIAYEAATKLIDVVSSGVIAFINAEDAVLKMNQALELTGSTTAKTTTDAFIRLGDSIEAMGIASTESILKLAKIGIAAGQTTSQTEKLIKVAADLSVAKEIPIDAAFKALSATIKGSAGQLSAFLPELKNLTEEQLKTGKAIEYVSLQVGGFAARNLETYAGKLELLKTRSGDVAESLGEILVKIVDLDNGIISTTESMERLNNWLQNSKEWIIALGQTIVSYLVDIWDAAVAKIRDWISFFQQVIGSAIYLFGKLQNVTDKFGKRNEDWGLKLISMGDDLLESAAKNREAYLNWSQGIEAVSVSTVNASSTAIDYIKRAREAKKALADIKLSAQSAEQLENGKKILDELIKKVNDLQKANAAAGKVGEEAIKAKYEADRKEIAAIKEKLEANKALTSEAQKYLSRASSLVTESQSLEIMKLRADTLKEINQQNSDLETSLKQINATQRQALDYELEARLNIIKSRREQISIEDKASLEALARQEELLKQTIEMKKETADMQFMDWIDALGGSINNLFGRKNIDEFFGYIKSKASELSQTPIIMEVKNTASTIPSYITDGMGKVAESVGNGAKVLLNAGGAVSSALVKAGGWIGAIIDVFMNADKYLNALIEFPKQFLKVIQNLPALIQKFIDSFPGMMQAIAEALPGILLKIVDMIPDFITAMIDHLPTLVERIAEIIPEVFIKLVSMIPKLIEILVKGTAKIIQGFIKGLIRGLGNVLSGIKMPRIKVDAEPLQKAASKFVGSASRIFKVGDVSEDVKDNLQKVTDSIKDAFRTGTNWLLDAWKWVLEKVLMPIYNFVRDAWLWVYEKVLMPIYNIVRDAWLWVYEKVLMPIYNIVRGAWLWVLEKVITPISQVITSAWQWVIDNVLEPLKTVGETIAKPFREAISSLIGLFEGVGNLFKGLFNINFDGMKKAFQDIFDKAGEGLINIFRSLINPFVDIFNGLISALNGLKIPEIGWSISAGKIGSWSGTLIPEVDLIPGEIGTLSKFAQGGLVQQGAFSLSGFGSDTVPSALTPGEFVVNRTGVETGGLGMLSALNRGQTPSGNPITVNIEVNLDAKMTMDEGYIRGTLIPRMTDELKRASLDGKFVLSSRGIR